MKCVRCQHDSKFKERGGRVCPQCKGRFAFEPREGDLLSDMAFLNAIKHVSSDEQVRWGVEHLYYEICRRKRLGKVGGFFAGLFGGDTRLVRVSRAQFDGLWQRWISAHGHPNALIIRQPEVKRKKPAVEPDIADYSFDRAVICDRARTVDLLLANNFHFENNCAVLSIGGYPPGPFATVRTMLKRNPRLQVFALHDATPAGCGLAHKLATDPEWFAGQARVVDVGLRPFHAQPFHGLLLRAENQTDAGQGTTREEAQWLSKYALELAAIRPEQVVKRLFRAISRKSDQDHATSDGGVTVGWSSGDSGGDGGDVVTDDNSFSSDAGASDGGGDSFG